MADSDLKQHVNSSVDFYALLEVEAHATEAEIRRGYRIAARKYHPDKVGANNKAALEIFHNIQIANGILSDENLKALYDNSRRAREEKKARESAFSDQRRAWVEELERREKDAVQQRQDVGLGPNELELRRLAARSGQDVDFLRDLQADGRRRVAELRSRRKTEQAQAEALQRHGDDVRQAESKEVPALERAIKVRFRKTEDTTHLNQERLAKVFSQFGEIEAIILKDKRLRAPGSKHREEYIQVWVTYKSLLGAHAAVSGFQAEQGKDTSLSLIEDVSWFDAKDAEKETSTTSRPTQTIGEIPRFDFSPKWVPEQYSKTLAAITAAMGQE